jgi:NADH-quinone oxidoreductase subunit L
VTSIILFAPLIGALVCGFGWRFLGEAAACWFATALLGLAAVLSWIVFFTVDGAAEHVQLLRWIESGTLAADWSIRLDRLTAIMLVVINTVSALVHLYSVGYMAHDENFHENESYRPRFFAYLSLFTFAMLMLVTADNLLQLFFGWEGVGLASYLLIGFYFRKPSANAAQIKAFVVNRVGDFAVLLGIFALYFLVDSIRLDDIFAAVGDLAQTQITFAWSTFNAAELVAFLLFFGAMGKSAQLFLHTWLPDAMEGPTPVSALIHAATMVTAGVFLLCRMSPVFEVAPYAKTFIIYIGAATAFFAATIGLVQNDIKRVIAYSTCSQLGYMFVAAGSGIYGAAMFHLFTHAFFKSLLFLCSGSVIHAVHSNEMTDMGGLRKKMPYTAWTMLVGCLAIAGAGIPFVIGLSGYYSKDMILMQAMWFAGERPIAGWVFYVAAGGAAITAFYMFRLWYMTFAGEPRDRHRYEHAHESPKVMYVPLLVLAALAVCVAWPVPFMGLSLAGMLASAQWPATDAASVLAVAAAADVHDYHVAATLIAFGTALGGFLLATVIYGLRKLNAEDARRRFAPVHGFLLNKWYFDELYQATFVRFTFFVSRLAADFDKKIIDGFIDRLAIWTRWTARVDDFIDRTFVDGLVNLLAGWTYGAGRSLRRVQTGKLHHYVMFIVLATVVLFVVISFWASLGPAGVRQPPPLPETPVETAAKPT